MPLLCRRLKVATLPLVELGEITQPDVLWRSAPLQHREAANLATGGSATAHSSEVLYALHLDHQSSG
jgi:hypothetical protein